MGIFIAARAVAEVVPLLALEGVEKSFAEGGIAPLRGVDLRVEEREFVVLEGISGAGKTTLLNLAGLLDDPTRGRVLFEGRDVAALSASSRSALRLRRVGFVFQHYYLVPDLTVIENVALPALAAGAAHESAISRAGELLSRVGIERARDRLPRTLSGGEQQRAGIARALANSPRLLVADEPTGNLDEASARGVARLLADAHASGVTVLLATHHAAQFPEATRRVRLDAGVVR